MREIEIEMAMRMSRFGHRHRDGDRHDKRDRERWSENIELDGAGHSEKKTDIERKTVGWCTGSQIPDRAIQT